MNVHSKLFPKYVVEYLPPMHVALFLAYDLMNSDNLTSSCSPAYDLRPKGFLFSTTLQFLSRQEYLRLFSFFPT
ncbi:unnamed protein product [Camellia sinensis]